LKDEKDNKKTSKIEEVEWKVIEKLANNKFLNNANNHLNKQTLNSNIKKKTKKEYTNFVAKKFDLVILIIKGLGYSVAVIMALMNAFDLGIWIGIFVAIATWLSTLILEAVAEGLQLLEDIKNK